MNREPMFLAVLESHVVGPDIWEIEHYEALPTDIYKVVHTKLEDAPFYNVRDMGAWVIPKSDTEIDFPDLESAYAYIDQLVRNARKGE